jgi:hypothetical protein
VEAPWKQEGAKSCVESDQRAELACPVMACPSGGWTPGDASESAR